jgi:hypothetical protein
LNQNVFVFTYNISTSTTEVQLLIISSLDVIINLIVADISSEQILDWATARDVDTALSGYSETVRGAAVEAESSDRILLLDTAIRSRLMDERTSLQEQLDAINKTLGYVYCEPEKTAFEIPKDVKGIEIEPFTLILRGRHKRAEVNATTAKTNAGYLEFISFIQRASGVGRNTAGHLAGILTTPYPEFSPIHAENGEVFTFHAENDYNQLTSARMRELPQFYPKAVTISNLTYERALNLRGIGITTAAALMRVAMALTASRPH